MLRHQLHLFSVQNQCLYSWLLGENRARCGIIYKWQCSLWCRAKGGQLASVYVVIIDLWFPVTCLHQTCSKLGPLRKQRVKIMTADWAISHEHTDTRTAVRLLSVTFLAAETVSTFQTVDIQVFIHWAATEQAWMDELCLSEKTLNEWEPPVVGGGGRQESTAALWVFFLCGG